MKRKFQILIALTLLGAMLACTGAEIKDDQAALTIGKIIARRLGIVTAQRYPVIVSLIEPVANAISESAANGDDLITILKRSLAECPTLNPIIKKDIQDLLELVEINNVPEVYQEIARAFLAGLSIYEIKSR